jgi:Ca-activated chloride channel family protein
VKVQVSGAVARATVTQVFANPFEEPVEAIYVFPLSERAAITDMLIVDR